VTIHGETPWEFAEKWYSTDSIHRELCRKSRDEIPNDITSYEFAEWLTLQYRLAMSKGIQIGREQEFRKAQQ